MSIETLQEITIQMHGSESLWACINAQQGDTSSRKVKIHLLDFDNKKYAVSSDAVAVLYVEKLDGHEVFDKCEIEEEGSLIVTLRNQTVACSGRQKAQIYIVSSDGTRDIKSQVFYLNVERAAYSEDAIESTDDYGVLRELIQSTKMISDSESERIKAEKNRADAEAERVYAELERTNAEFVRQNAEKNRAEAVIKAVQNAEDAVEKANEAIEVVNTTAPITLSQSAYEQLVEDNSYQKMKLYYVLPDDVAAEKGVS